MKIRHLEWTNSAVIDKINTWQFALGGTIRAADSHLPRLKELCVDILWLMPVQEIGVKCRKSRARIRSKIVTASTLSSTTG